MWEHRFVGTEKTDDGKDASRAQLLRFNASYWPNNAKVKRFLSGGSMVRLRERGGVVCVKGTRHRAASHGIALVV